ARAPDPAASAQPRAGTGVLPRGRVRRGDPGRGADPQGRPRPEPAGQGDGEGTAAVTERPLRPLVTAERRRELDGQPAVVVAVHAHPDDETLATGIALAHFAARGDWVHVITCTLGEEGEVIPPELAHLEGSPELAQVRREELAGAMAVIGVRNEFLGSDTPRWRDSGMAGSPAAQHPDAFAAAD